MLNLYYSVFGMPSYSMHVPNFMEKNGIGLNLLVKRNSIEKSKVMEMEECLESVGWDYKAFGKKTGYKLNEQLRIFAKKEGMSLETYLQELFRNDLLNKPLVYDSSVIMKGKKMYYSIFTVWAADINFSKAPTLLGDVEQITFEFEKDCMNARVSRKSHYYPNSSRQKGKNIWVSINEGNHYPSIIKGGENFGIVEGRKYCAHNGCEVYLVDAKKNLRKTLNFEELMEEKVSAKLKVSGSELAFPVFERYWSYTHPELMFSLKGKIFGSIDALIYTF
jgi:hypothetical protein